MSGVETKGLHPGGPTQEALFALVAGRMHPDAAAWVRAHVDQCPQCEAHAARVRAVHALLTPPELSPFQRQRDLAAVRRRLESKRRAPATTRALWAGGLALAASALAPLGRGLLPSSSSSVDVLVVERAEEARLDGAPVAASGRVAAGARLEVGAAGALVGRWGAVHLSLTPATVAWIDPGGGLIHLEAGRILLDVAPLPAGGRLAVETREGVVEVRGTVFSVEESAQGMAVSVEEGRVEVRQAGQVVLLEAQQALAAGASTVSLLAEDRHRELAIFAPARSTARVGAQLAPATAPASQPSVAERLREARQALAAGEAARASALLATIDRRGLPLLELSRLLLVEGQAARLEGKAERAVTLFEQATRSGGVEAEQARLFIGQTLLQDLHDPGRAARAFQRAADLAPEGLFAPEIAFRMGQSLLASGQTQEGLRALARFLERPDGALHRDAAHLLVAAQLEADGDPRGALLHFDAVLGSGAVEGPEAAEALIGAARSESALGRRTEAARRYRLYLDRAPAGPHAPEARAALAPSAP